MMSSVMPMEYKKSTLSVHGTSFHITQSNFSQGERGDMFPEEAYVVEGDDIGTAGSYHLYTEGVQVFQWWWDLGPGRKMRRPGHQDLQALSWLQALRVRPWRVMYTSLDLRWTFLFMYVFMHLLFI